MCVGLLLLLLLLLVRRQLEEIIRLVLDDQKIVLLADGIHVTATLDTLSCSGWVVAGRHSIEDMGFPGASAGDRIPRGEDMVEGVWEETLTVHGHADGADAERRHGLERGGEAKGLGDDGVGAGAVAEHTNDLLKGAGVADGGDGAPVGVWRCVHELDVLGDEADELGGSGALAVVEPD